MCGCIFTFHFTDIPLVNVSTVGDVIVGINITISCDISSVSNLATINWMKDSITLTLNNNITKDTVKWSGGTLLSPSLNIYFIQKEDEGNYSCIATNAAKHTGRSKPVHLTVSEGISELINLTSVYAIID